jgi:AAHS family 4-hydroxybenzoate transporter-like MFS transporter
MKATMSLDLEQVIDQQSFGKFHFRVAALCAVSVLLDGFDAQVMGFVAPSLAQQWHISRAALSPILSSGLLGMLLGALLFGPLADRFGRKPVLVFCTLWFGIFSLLTSRADSVQSMLVLRLITGFGLGGTMPNAIALTAEYMPKRIRATGVMIMFTGFTIGAAAGGVVAAALIPHFGWQSVFVLGGLLPCGAAMFLFGLPESLRFLVLKGGEDSRLANILHKVAPDVKVPPGTSFVAGERRERGFVVKQLFALGRAKLTLLLWVIYFMSLLDLFFLNSWLPTILHDAGLSLRQAILITTMFQVGGAVASIFLGRFIDRMTSYRVLAWAYLGASVCVFLVGAAGTSVVLGTIVVFAAGFCVIGAQTGANALTAESYPTGIRSTGTGWALGIGRIGSIVGPLVGGLLLSSELEVKRVFWVAAVPPLIAAVASFVVTQRSKRNLKQ